jgi:hypothetical protein
LRRKLYLGLLVAVLSLPAQTLRSLGDQRGIKIGAAADPQYLGGQYSTSLSQQFSLEFRWRR